MSEGKTIEDRLKALEDAAIDLKNENTALTYALAAIIGKATLVSSERWNEVPRLMLDIAETVSAAGRKEEAEKLSTIARFIEQIIKDSGRRWLHEKL